MTIYTRGGDDGSASRRNGVRESKSSPIFGALGDVDELNCELGLCIQKAAAEKLFDIADCLAPVQGELFRVGAILAAAREQADAEWTDAAVTRMEGQIDSFWAQLPELTHFIIPGGSELACCLHDARATCRRAERSIVAATQAHSQTPPGVRRYINRLSDLLFTLARWANKLAGCEEKIWMP
jgi:cob(I)alamin adenosyltransferase